MSNITIAGDEFTEIWGKDFVNNVIYKTIIEIKKYPHLDEATFLCLANGGNWFFNMILQGLDYVPLHIEYALLKSYDGDERKELKELTFPNMEKLRNRRIFIVDDIMDSGNTVAYVIDRLLEIGVKTINVCVLCKRESAKLGTWNDPLIVEDGKWLVGCGMDYKGMGRNLGAIYGKI